MVEKNPWWRNVSGPFPKWEGPIGCKADGGGCHYARGKVGNKLVHTAVHNRDVAGERPRTVSGIWVQNFSAAICLLSLRCITVCCHYLPSEDSYTSRYFLQESNSLSSQERT